MLISIKFFQKDTVSKFFFSQKDTVSNCVTLWSRHLAGHLLIDGGLSIKPKNWQEDFRDLFEEQPYSGVRPQLEDYLKSHQNLARIPKINPFESNSS